MPIKDIWLRVYEKWTKKGADRSYAAWMANQAEKRYIHKQKCQGHNKGGKSQLHPVYSDCKSTAEKRECL